jgi:hypothetical protein
MVGKYNQMSDKSVLARVTEEMDKPRLALSARTFFFGRHVMAIKPRFRDGEIVHNRFANEDGRVMGSYDKEGVCMYAVSVLFIAPPREHAPYSSDWAEDCLEPSDKTQFLR